MDSNQAFYDTVPTSLPRTNSQIAAKIARFALRVLGWRFEGEVPNIEKAVVVIAPHTSNVDFLVLVLAKYSLCINASYIMKKEAFIWPFKKFFMDVGGIPIDRSQPARIVNQVTNQFREHPSLWLAITPEGTRKKVEKYKTGFARIAHAAGVPVVVLGFNYRDKVIRFDKYYSVSDDYEKEAADLRHYIKTKFIGRYPDKQ